VKLYIDLTKLNSERKNNRTTDRKSLNRLSRQQNVFTHTAQRWWFYSTKTYPYRFWHSYLTNMRYNLFVFFSWLNYQDTN